MPGLGTAAETPQRMWVGALAPLHLWYPGGVGPRPPDVHLQCKLVNYTARHSADNPGQAPARPSRATGPPAGRSGPDPDQGPKAKGRPELKPRD